MASSVATTFHSAADGEQFTAAAFRLGAGSHSTVVNDGSDALKSRSGVVPGAGTPLDVTQLGTPAMQVTVKKGTVSQQSTSATGGMYFHSLTADTNLDIATANATNPRLDAVVATVFDDGTSASNTKIEVLTGVAAASPVLPAALSSPPANTHYFPLAQVRVDAAVTSIVTAKITKPTFGSLVMGQFTCAPGGTVRGVTRKIVSTRSPSNDGILDGTWGSLVARTLTSTEAQPGVWVVVGTGQVVAQGTVDAGTLMIEYNLTTPSESITFYREVRFGRADTATLVSTYVLESTGTTPGFNLQAKPTGGNITAIGITWPCTLSLTRVSDL